MFMGKVIGGCYGEQLKSEDENNEKIQFAMDVVALVESLIG